MCFHRAVAAPATFSMSLITLIVIFSALPALAQSGQGQNDEYRYRATFVETPPVVDGDTSDGVWALAQVIDQFTQQEPASGAPATEKTEIRLVYDSEALYISAYCYDSDPAGVVRNVLRFRDDSVWSKDDVIRITLDTFHDHRRAYVFSINPLGTKQDSQVDNTVWNPNWDEVWDVRTRIQEDGWSFEIRIPFRVLRFPAEGGGIWGFNVQRLIKRKNETSSWAPFPPSFSLSRADLYGHLEGISQIEPRRNAQFIPYGLLGATRSNGPAGNDSTLEGGADMKVAVASSLSLDLTYNTNFAQVEADDQQVNLTRFSLFFPEKREFFLENASLFNFGIDQDTQLFFSRRIGLARGAAVPILGGARMSGKAGPFDIGLLTTQTERTDQSPGANLSTARIRWNVGRRAYIGGIVTSSSSDLQSNRAYGTDALYWLSRDLRAEGFIAAVDDRDVNRQPVSYSAALTYNTDLWGAGLRTLSVEENFDPAIGYVRRDNIRRQTGNLRRSWRLNRSWARKVNFSSNFTYLTNQQDMLDTRQWQFEASDELESGGQVRFQLSRNFERIFAEDDPFVINPRQGIVIPAGDYGFNRWLIAYQGFDGSSIVPGVRLERGQFYGGDRTTLGLSGIWRASPHLMLQGDYEFNDISLPQGAFNTHLWRTRVTVPITARVTADAFLQWNGLNQQGEQELNTQLRLHVIYARDSNLFLVFSDQRRDRGNGVTATDRAAQVKMTYRLYW
jgi:hypothetical protein